MKAFSDLLLEALDPDVPTRAAALRTLTHMLQNKTAEALQAQEKILNVSEALGGCVGSRSLLVYEEQPANTIISIITQFCDFKVVGPNSTVPLSALVCGGV